MRTILIKFNCVCVCMAYTIRTICRDILHHKLYLGAQVETEVPSVKLEMTG
jgi:hypothetical protein